MTKKPEKKNSDPARGLDCFIEDKCRDLLHGTLRLEDRGGRVSWLKHNLSYKAFAKLQSYRLGPQQAMAYIPTCMPEASSKTLADTCFRGLWQTRGLETSPNKTGRPRNGTVDEALGQTVSVSLLTALCAQ